MILEETGLKTALIFPASADHLELSEKMSLAGSERGGLFCPESLKSLNLKTRDHGDNPTPQQTEIRTADTASKKIPAAFTVQHTSLNIFMSAMPNAKINRLIMDLCIWR